MTPNAKDHIRKLHASPFRPINDVYVDSLLFGDSSPELNARILQTMDNHDLSRYGDEKIYWEGTDIIWTPYTPIRNLLYRLPVTRDLTVWDLGSGFGRLPLYGGIVNQARFIGVEIVPWRVRTAVTARDALGLRNVEFLEGNILDHDFSSGDVFYIYGPLGKATTREIIRRLELIARHKPVTLAVRGPLKAYERQRWLRFDGPLTDGPFHEWRGIYLFHSA